MLQWTQFAFERKALDDEQRIIEGTASTPTADRMSDVVDPEGAVYTLPLPLLWQHDKDQPIGQVIDAAVTRAGIRIRAQIAKGVLPSIDERWALIKAGLVRGLSIGFRPLTDPEPIKGSRGFRWKSWEWLELSTVTVPANADASIAMIRSLDLAAIDPAHHPRLIPPGASGIKLRHWRDG